MIGVGCASCIRIRLMRVSDEYNFEVTCWYLLPACNELGGTSVC